MDDNRIIAFLKESKNIAVYGMSKNKEKPANHVPVYLIENNYNIIPINPGAEEIEGRKCYSNLMDIEGKIDILDIFRPAKDVPAIVDEAVNRKKEKGDIQLIWVQEGIESPEGKEKALAAGIDYIENICILKEHKRLIQ